MKGGLGKCLLGDYQIILLMYIVDQVLYFQNFFPNYTRSLFCTSDQA